MNIKKAVLEAIIKKLESERSDLQYQVLHNKREIKDLVKKQTLVKRQIPALTYLIRNTKRDNKTLMEKKK